MASTRWVGRDEPGGPARPTQVSSDGRLGRGHDFEEADRLWTTASFKHALRTRLEGSATTCRSIEAGSQPGLMSPLALHRASWISTPFDVVSQ